MKNENKDGNDDEGGRSGKEKEEVEWCFYHHSFWYIFTNIIIWKHNITRDWSNQSFKLTRKKYSFQ